MLSAVSAKIFSGFKISSKNTTIAPELSESTYLDEEEETDEGISVEELENIRLLFDYVSMNGEKCANDKDKLTAFGRLVTKCLEDMPADNKLADILQEHGWSGLKFLHIISIDFNALQKSLGTLYMNSRQQRAKCQRNMQGDSHSRNAVGSPADSRSVMNMMSKTTSFKGALDTNMFVANATHEEDGTAQQGIASFCPDSLISTVLNTTMMKFLPNEPVISEPMSQKFFGVSLLADISGFTKLSSGFCLRGSAGLDDLHGVTSGFLGRLVRIVYWFNGDVIAFAGDALVCVFVDSKQEPSKDPGSIGPEQGLAGLLRAPSQGEFGSPGSPDNIKSSMSISRDDYEPSLSRSLPPGSHRSGSSRADNAPYFLKALYAALCLVCCDTNDLTAHAALSAGEMGIATLGGTSDEWTYLLNGPCIAELCCIDDAKSKEVVITPILYNMLKTLDSSAPNPNARQLTRITDDPNGSGGHSGVLTTSQTPAVDGSLTPAGTTYNGAGGTNTYADGTSTFGGANPSNGGITGTFGGDLKSYDDKVLADVLYTTEGVPSGAVQPGIMPMGQATASSGVISGEQSPSPDKPRGYNWDRIDFEQSNITCLPSGNYLIKSLHVSACVDHVHRSSKYGGNAKFVMPNKCNAPNQLRMVDRVAPLQMLAKRYDKHEDSLDITENVAKLTPFVPLTITSDDDGSEIPTISVNPELREVTTVFVNLNSYDKDLNADPITLQPFFLLCQEALLEVDGFLRQFLVDDKGCVLIAMWGVPSFTYPNNGSRAVYFARKLKNTTNAANMKVSIGITTGNVYCGTIGSIIRRDYVAIGHTVNMSARLMGKAKGRILVDTTTYQLLPIASRDELTQGEELQLKGTVGVTRPWVAEYVGMDLAVGFDLEGEDVTGDEPLVKTDIGRMLRIALDEMQSTEQMSTQRAAISAEAAVGRMGLNRMNSNEMTSTPVKGRNLSLRPSMNPNSQSAAGAMGIAAANATGSFTGIPGSAVSSYVPVSYVSYGSELAAAPRRGLSIRPSRGVTADEAAKFGGLGPTHVTTPVDKGKVTFIVVNGGSGMGKTNVAKFFRYGAKRRLLRHIYIQLHLGDESTPHKLLKMLVVQLIGESFFVGEEKQINVIQYLLKTSFPDIDTDDLHFLLTNVSEALDLKWNEESISRSLEGGGPGRKKRRNPADGTKIGANTYVGRTEEKPKSRKLSMFGGAAAGVGAEKVGAEKPPKNRNQSMFGNGGIMGLLRGSISESTPSPPGGSSSGGIAAPPGSTRGGPSGAGGVDVAGAMAAAALNAERADYSPPGPKQNSLKTGGPPSMKNRTGSVFAPIGSFFFGNKEPSVDEADASWGAERSLSVSVNSYSRHRNPSRSSYSVLTPVATVNVVLCTLLAQKKTVIIVDDAHHADEMSLKELFGLFGKKLALTVLLTENQAAGITITTGGGMQAGGSERRVSGASLSQRRGTRMTVHTDGDGSTSPVARDGSMRMGMAAMGGSMRGIAGVSVRPMSPNSGSERRISAGGGMPTRGVSNSISTGVNKFTQLKAHPDCTSVVLTKLDMSEVNTLLVSHFKENSTALPDTLAQTVLDASSGNPFWCNTIANHIKDKGVENFSETLNDATLEESSVSKNPLSVLILCRLDSLPSGAQLLLKNACVIGEQVSRAELESVSPISVQAHIDDYLQLLVASGFIYNIDIDYYAFYNQIIRKAIMEIIPPSESYAVHEGVAKFIELQNTSEPDLRQFYVTLSFHYSLSGPTRVKETFYYTMKSVEFAVESSSMSMATTYIQQAIAILQQNSPYKTKLISKSTKAKQPVPHFPPNAYAENITSIIVVINDSLKILNPGGVLTQAVRMVKSSVSGDYTKAQLTQGFLNLKDTAESMLRTHNVARGVHDAGSVRSTVSRGITRGISSATLAVQEKSSSFKSSKNSRNAVYFGEQSIDQNLDLAAKNAAKSAKNITKPVISPTTKSKNSENDSNQNVSSPVNNNKQQGYVPDEPTMSGASLRKKNEAEAETAKESGSQNSNCTIM